MLPYKSFQYSFISSIHNLDSITPDSGNEKQQYLEDMLEENYEVNEYASEDSEYEDNGEKEMEDVTIQEQEGWDDLEAEDEREQNRGSDESESGIGEKGESDEEGHKEWEKGEGKEYDSSEGVAKFSHSSTDEIQKGKAVIHQIGEQKCGSICWFSALCSMSTPI